MLSTALRYFLEVARTGSISEASERLHLTGPAISRQIARLEERVGATLFERTTRGVILTPAGELLLDYASRSEAEAERIALLLRDRGETPAPLRVAATDGLADAATQVAQALLREVPGLELTLSIGQAMDVARKVREGDAQIGFGLGLPAQDPELEVRQSWPARVVAILHRRHPLAGCQAVGAEELIGFDLALPAHSSLSGILALLGTLRPQGGHGVLRTDSFACLLRAVRYSDAVGLASDLSLHGRRDRKDYCAVPLRLTTMPARSAAIILRAGVPHRPETVLFATRAEAFMEGA
ncbi:LysR family transcriptional regulator [Roseomonas sp. GC11]|uniref:LysR family transcriptional regulator n=1 Tax=Roseomonas sp. GC11 TaxID=2950546 RepID=UPI00210A0C35|nr:LysR family transcriptional regulator [Roseomonas sp. GC11]MCQ4162044.1 LysR family transcriptional regulator [Roseomonas sp. GC11]